MSDPLVGLTNNMMLVFRALTAAENPVSGRRLAGSTGLSTTTVIKALHGLAEKGLAVSTSSSNALVWTAADGPTASQELSDFGSSDADQWKSTTDATRTVLVLTALPLEFAAIRRHLASHRTVRAHGGTRLAEGAFFGRKITWRVLLAEAGMGNSSAASLSSQLAFEFGVDIVGFVGVGGGRKPKDQARGDVVVALSVFDGHASKHQRVDGQSTVSARPNSHTLPFALQQLAREVTRSDWNAGLVGDRPDGQPVASLDVVVSGEAVLADPQDPFLAWIDEHVNHAKVVDMESYGVYVGAHTAGAAPVSVRGLSDLIENKEPGADETWQPRAARNAAEFFFRMLYEADPRDVPVRDSNSTPGPADLGRDGQPVTPPDYLLDWHAALAKQSPEQADDAVTSLTSRAEPIATWVNRAVYRPPGWLRQDRTGLAWWLVAHLADGASVKSGDAYRRAAETAAEAERPADAAGYELFAALSDLPQPAEQADGSGSTYFSTESEAVRAVLAVGDALVPGMRFVTEFWTSYLTGADDVLARAAVALTALGENPSSSGLDTLVDQDICSTSIHGLNGLLRRHLVARIQVAVATRWTAQHVLRARTAADAACSTLPQSTNARLLQCYAMLLPLVPMPRSGGSDIASEGDDSAVYERIVRGSLDVRAVRAEWGGDTAEPLALAIRASYMSGDAQAAIRMGRGSPDGTATDKDASSPQVRHQVAVAALLVGDVNLVLSLADVMENDIETDLLRATAFEQAQGLENEARDLYRKIADDRDVRDDQRTRALYGLVRLGVSTDPSVKGNIARHVETLQKSEPETADMITAHEHMNNGRPRDVLALTRRYPQSDMAVHLQAEALASDGDPERAIDLLLAVANARGDDVVRASALRLASRHDLVQRVRGIAQDLTHSSTPQLSRRGYGALIDVAMIDQDWPAVARYAKKALSTLDGDRTGASQDRIPFRWMLAQAQHNNRQFTQAFDTLWTLTIDGVTEPDPLVPASAERAAIVFFIVRTASEQKAIPSLTDEQYDWLTSIASRWVDDEKILAMALTCMMLVPVARRSHSQLARDRALQEDYFRRYSERGASLKRISVGDDFEQLQQYVRESRTERDRTIEEYAAKVRLGQMPMAVVCDMANRSYAEQLIRSATGAQIVTGEPPEVQHEQLEAARAAVGGQVAVDTSALVFVSTTSARLADLTSSFNSVKLASELRFDVLRARGNLDMRSPGTVGWNDNTNSMAVCKYPEELPNRWADRGRALTDDLQFVEVPARVVREQQTLWDAAMILAKEMGLPLWADDVALRVVARSMAVPTFGTLDLVEALVEVGHLNQKTGEEFTRSLREARAVDLPIDGPWHLLAELENWDPNGYVALAISRPFAWRDMQVAIGCYRQMIRAAATGDPPDVVQRIAQWAFVGCTGAAWACPPPTRPRVVGALLAWTVLADHLEMLIEPGANETLVQGVADRLAALLEVGLSIQVDAFPAGDIVDHVVAVLADLLRTNSSDAMTGRVLAGVFARLPEELREKAWRRFLKASTI